MGGGGRFGQNIKESSFCEYHPLFKFFSRLFRGGVPGRGGTDLQRTNLPRGQGKKDINKMHIIKKSVVMSEFDHFNRFHKPPDFTEAKPFKG